MKADKVYLVGFMAAGKTTVARALARRLGWEAVDIDEIIEQRERQTIAEIFARRGEAYFRALERQALLDQVPRRHIVVAIRYAAALVGHRTELRRQTVEQIGHPSPRG